MKVQRPNCPFSAACPARLDRYSSGLIKTGRPPPPPGFDSFNPGPFLPRLVLVVAHIRFYVMSRSYGWPPPGQTHMRHSPFFCLAQFSATLPARSGNWPAPYGKQIPNPLVDFDVSGLPMFEGPSWWILLKLQFVVLPHSLGFPKVPPCTSFRQVFLYSELQFFGMSRC